MEIVYCEFYSARKRCPKQDCCFKCEDNNKDKCFSINDKCCGTDRSFRLRGYPEICRFYKIMKG